jgi:hypothetical protein
MQILIREELHFTAILGSVLYGYLSPKYVPGMVHKIDHSDFQMQGISLGFCDSHRAIAQIALLNLPSVANPTHSPIRICADRDSMHVVRITDVWIVDVLNVGIGTYSDVKPGITQYDRAGHRNSR